MHTGATTRTTTRRAVGIGHATIVSMMLSLVLLTPSYAGIFWEEEFNDPYFLSWGGQDGVAPFPGFLRVTTNLPYSGPTSLEMKYNDTNGGWIDRQHPLVDEVYTRFYYRTLAFTYDPLSGTKHFRQDNLTTPYFYPNFWFENLFGSREMSVVGQSVLDPVCFNQAIVETCNYYPNREKVPLADNQWYCIETHLKMNTPGVADGLIEVWIDGRQTLGYYNRSFRGAAVNGPNGNSSLTQFGNVRMYLQSGIGTMYYDLFAVGTSRIGCSGSSSPSPTPPPSLTVR